MTRLSSLALASAWLVLPAVGAGVGGAASARTLDDGAARLQPAATDGGQQMSCASGGRCLAVDGHPTIGAGSNLWTRTDPLALGQGTRGDVLGQLPDD